MLNVSSKCSGWDTHQNYHEMFSYWRQERKGSGGRPFLFLWGWSHLVLLPRTCLSKSSVLDCSSTKWELKKRWSVWGWSHSLCSSMWQSRASFKGNSIFLHFFLCTEKTEALSRLSNFSCLHQMDKNKPYIHMRQETNTAFGSSLWLRRLNCLKSITCNFEMSRLGWKREPVFS